MKILIIEDEKQLAQSIADYLSEENYLCEFASTFKNAMDKIDMYQYNCILLDIMLPDGDGMQILEELRKQQKQDGIIIISAKDSLEDKYRDYKSGQMTTSANLFIFPNWQQEYMPWSEGKNLEAPTLFNKMN